MSKFRFVFRYFLIMVESILLVLFIMLLILKFTVLDSNYVLDILDKTDYYHELYQDIHLEMSYYTGQSGFADDILKDTFTEDDVKNQVQQFITDFYQGKIYDIDVSLFQEKLNSKINQYLENKNFDIIHRDEIDRFVVEMSKIYKEKICIISNTGNIAHYFHIGINITNKVLVILMGIILILFIMNWFVLKKKNFDMVFYVTMFLLISFYIYITNRIHINHLLIYNQMLSDVIIYFIHQILRYMLIISFACFVIGVFLTLIYVSFLRKKRIKK